MASPVRREGKQLLYSRSSDKHDLVSLPLIQSQRRKEYCHIRHFEKEGVGIVQYYNEDGIPTHSLLCRWIKGKICGKAYLFDMVEEKFSSVLTFADDKLMEEEPFSWGDLSIGIIDEFDGSRWEGMCLQEKAHGQGMFYDERNINIYSGYCMNGKKAGLGISFYNFPNGSAVPKEIACWYHGQTYGLITLFDRRGDYLDTQISVAGVTVGETINCVPGESLVFYPFVKKIVIADYCGQDEMSVFDLSHCSELISLTIGDHCFPRVVGCSFCHLPHLQEVMIGKDCFTFCNRSTHIPWETGCQQRIKKSRLSFELCHCPSLEVFECKEGSFSSYSGCTIEDLPRIRCLHLGAIAEENEEYEQGSWCFYWNASLVLKDLPCLEEIVFGNFSFYFCNSVIVDRRLEWKRK